MIKLNKTGLITFLICALPALLSFKQITDPVNNETIAYKTDIRPIITKNCIACHNQFDSYNGLMTIVEVKNPKNSKLYDVIANPYTSLIMPTRPLQPLDAAQKNMIKTWITLGAPETK